MPRQADGDDPMSSSPISSLPDSIFEFKGENNSGVSTSKDDGTNDGNSPGLLAQLEAMEKAKMEEESRQADEEAPVAEIQVATEKKRSNKLNTGKSKSKLPASKRTKRSKKWETEFIVEDPKSPLVKVDIRELLSHPKAWTVLSLEEKQRVLAKFPDDEHILSPGTDQAAPNIESLRNNDNFRHDAVCYRDNISRGVHDSQWLSEAWVAHEKRAAGYFDEFRVVKFQEDWSVRLPEEMRALDYQVPKSQPIVPPGPEVPEDDELAGSSDPFTAATETRPMESVEAVDQPESTEAMHVDGD
ncbi:hypothetical protein NKR23_g11875 [Pleurostoma richardsiae]|uniref:ASX DEUBAD domain-containing protein n=1 Tax=Pleurostoma richardsiae TaxID=41990 RepID=A0AA38RI51_9PEZI|nr:hypothetical protein NKR23_g11875 [Pleurostoma richardsiae]